MKSNEEPVIQLHNTPYGTGAQEPSILPISQTDMIISLLGVQSLAELDGMLELVRRLVGARG